MSVLVGNLHPEFRAFWHPVAWSCEVTEQPVAVTLLGEPLVVVRPSTGNGRAFVDECPHRGAPLSLGRFEGDELVCAFHGWRFGPEGAATVHPFTRTVTHRSRLERDSRRLPGVCERYGIVWVALERSAGTNRSWPDGDDSRFGEFTPTAHTSEVLAAYQTDNLFDSSHFPFLHESLSSRNPMMGEQEISRPNEFGFSTAQRKLADDDVSTEGWLRYTLSAPFTVLLRSEEPDGEPPPVVLPSDPTDRRERHTRFFFMVRVPETDPAALRELQAVEEIVQQEDLWITAALRRRGMPRRRCARSARTVRWERNPVSTGDAPPAWRRR